MHDPSEMMALIQELAALLPADLGSTIASFPAARRHIPSGAPTTETANALVQWATAQGLARIPEIRQALRVLQGCPHPHDGTNGSPGRGRFAGPAVPFPPAEPCREQQPRPDVFVSYNGKDRGTVRQLVYLLADRGIRAWLDEERPFPGDEWQSRAEEAIEAAGAVIVCIGASGLSSWQEREVRACTEELVRSDSRLIPVLLPE